MKCPSCNEDSVEDDTHYGKVCTSCGYIIQEQVFESDVVLEGTTAVNQSRSHLSFNGKEIPRSLKIHNKRNAISKEFGLDIITSIASHLHLQSFVKEEIAALFTKLIGNDHFKLGRFPKKVALVACCTYIVLRKRGFPIMISRICNFLQCSSTNFSKIFHMILQYTEITVNTPAIDELVPTVLKNINFGDEIVNIIPLVLDILHVAYSCWITCGRIPQPYIIASGFIAWKSLSYERRKCSFAAFCKKMHVVQHRISATIRVKELSLALMKLAEELPWIEKEKVDIKNVPYMLDSILKHSELLRTSATQLEDDKQSNDCKEYQTFRTAVVKKRKQNEMEYDKFPTNFNDDDINIYIRTVKEVRNVEKFLREQERTVRSEGNKQLNNNNQT